MILRRVKICSTHGLAALNPACSSRSFRSTDVLHLYSSIQDKAFPGTDDKVIPRQLLQSDASPFFDSFTITLFCHSIGTTCFFQHLLRSIACLAARSRASSHKICFSVKFKCIFFGQKVSILFQTINIEKFHRSHDLH